MSILQRNMNVTRHYQATIVTERDLRELIFEFLKLLFTCAVILAGIEGVSNILRVIHFWKEKQGVVIFDKMQGITRMIHRVLFKKTDFNTILALFHLTPNFVSRIRCNNGGGRKTFVAEIRERIVVKLMPNFCKFWTPCRIK